MKLVNRVAQPAEKQLPQRYRASWHGAVLAEGSDTVIVEGNHYFALADVRADLLQRSNSHTTCHWKGVASYYDVVVGDEVNHDAAWYYADPSPKAESIRDRVAFWHGVKVEPVEVAPQP
jgi:uncharacterized protein (DUF427 family)